jgi:hypothetical protein
MIDLMGANLASQEQPMKYYVTMQPVPEATLPEALNILRCVQAYCCRTSQIECQKDLHRL